MTAQKVLVTGGTGFTGGHLCRRLAKEGHTVRTIVRNPDCAANLIPYGIEIVKGDLRDPVSLRQAMQGVELVYHIAALFRPENVTSQDMWEINAQGAQNMLEAAIQAGVKRFVHCSTIGVHGDVKHPPANEESPYNPGDHYQKSKLEGELIAQRYMHEERLPITIVRPAGIYGPGDLRFLKLVRSIKSGKFVMIGSGKTRFHAVYIDDLVDGFLLCGNAEQAVGNIYILAGEESVELNRMVKVIAEILRVSPPRWRVPYTPVYWAGYLCEIAFKPLGIHPPLYRRRVDFFKKTRFFDITKAKKHLSYAPKIDLKTGFERTIDWYCSEGLL